MTTTGNTKFDAHTTAWQHAYDVTWKAVGQRAHGNTLSGKEAKIIVEDVVSDLLDDAVYTGRHAMDYIPKKGKNVKQRTESARKEAIAELNEARDGAAAALKDAKALASPKTGVSYIQTEMKADLNELVAEMTARINDLEPTGHSVTP